MAATVLDEVDNLLQDEATSRVDSWRDLVIAFADGALPAPSKVMELFQRCGKNRKDLEAEGALLKEYRMLQAFVEMEPRLRAELQKANANLSESLKAKEEAEKQLNLATLKVRLAHESSAAVDRQVRDIDVKRRQLLDPKYNPIKPSKEHTLTPEAARITEQISRIETRLKTIDADIANKKREAAEFDQAQHSYDGYGVSVETARDDKNALHSKYLGCLSAVDRLTGEAHYLGHDLVELKKELAELTSPSTPKQATENRSVLTPR